MMQTKAERADVFRHEVKYYLSRRDEFLLVQYLRRIMRVDRHAGADGQYWIRSLYFDTLENRDYHDKINGYSERKKLRLRIYDTAEGSAMLELKSKSSAYVHKEGLRLSKADAIRLINNDFTFLCSMQSNTAGKFFTCFSREHRRPVILIDYKRTAFELPFENIRITIDKDVRASMNVHRLFDKSIPSSNVIDGACCILEVKYRHTIPNFIRSILSDIGTPNESISKYILSRQAIHF